jgi:hypothetical protein
MQEMDGSSWKRQGCSIVWSPDLLGPLLREADAVPLRTVLGWLNARFPESPPGGRRTVLVWGLQTVLTTLPDVDSRYQWLRQHVLPLNREFASQWDRVGLVFGMNGPRSFFEFNEADDLVYFGRGSDRAGKILITRGMWNGAATGSGAYQLIVPGTKEVGGYHVQRIS